MLKTHLFSHVPTSLTNGFAEYMSSEHCTAPLYSDSSHVTAPYKLSFYYYHC